MSRSRWLFAVVPLLFFASAPLGAAEEETFDEDTIVGIATDFFGQSSELIAKTLEKVFKDFGRPNAYIAGEEISGALVIGLRYGNGQLNAKTIETTKVYWQGPSIGFDVGGNAAKVFVLVYHLGELDDLFQRFPGVDGSFYFVAGLSVNYQKSGDIVLAPVRAGVGLRAGANVGYLHYSRKHSWLPF